MAFVSRGAPGRSTKGVARNQVVQFSGEIDNSFYVIVSGEVTVSKGGREVDVLVGGDCFGEMGFIAGTERTASILAKTPVTAMKVRASLIERASLHCQLRFHKVFLNTLVERLSQTTARVFPGAS